MTFQILGVQHLLNGEGLSFAHISADNLSAFQYRPITKWPPVFSLLYIPFYILFGKNYIAAAIAMGIVAAIGLIFVTRAILKTLDLPIVYINLFTLLTGFFGYYFYTIPNTDPVGITIFLFACYLCLKMIKKGKTSNTSLFIFMLALLASGLFKYLFILPTMVIPFFLILKGHYTQNKNLLKGGIISFMVLLFVFGGFLLFQKINTGDAAYIQSTARGFFPENLNSFFPFLSGSFLRPDTVDYFLSSHSNFSTQVFKGFQIISLIGFILIIVLLLRSRPIKTIKKTNISSDFFLLSFLISISLISILIYLSVTVGKENYDFSKWTYVQEARYYGIIIIMAQIAAFIALFQFQIHKLKLQTFLISLLIFLMIPDFFRGVVFSANRIMNIGKETYGWQYELAFQKTTDNLLHQLKNKNPGDKIVLTGTSDWMTLRASLYSHYPVFTDVAKLNSPEKLKTSLPVILFAIIRDADLKDYNSFISLKGVDKVGSGHGFHFFSYRIAP
ncbi:MAG: hypothetical protein BWZ05_00707 [Bacteroidetes bacterium ADurb.BinA245]|nr:MAG: hypothetical protein BWZ05_00707 [Bacteroidetes bacterium ADurb.BinA245]